jgi:hypothetical protein
MLSRRHNLLTRLLRAYKLLLAGLLLLIWISGPGVFLPMGTR